MDAGARLSCKEMNHGPGPTAHSCRAHRHPEDQDTAGRTSWGGSPGAAAPCFQEDLAHPTANHRPNQGPSQVSWDVGQSANAATAEWDPVRSPASQSLALSLTHGGWEHRLPVGLRVWEAMRSCSQTPAPTHGRLCAGRTIIRNRPICDSEGAGATLPHQLTQAF